MPETLLSISEVLLYGRVMKDIIYDYTSPAEAVPAANAEAKSSPPRLGRAIGGNSDLQNQLAPRNLDTAAKQAKSGPRFARIYGFSYEGCYHELDAPILMLVHGPGVPAESAAGDARASRAPDNPDKTGGAASTPSFADGIRVWSYDKGDHTIRMDTAAGSIERVLLDVEIGTGMGPVSGGRVSGGRVSGGRVSGGRVSGGRVSGGRVSGGRVSGKED